jgi:hypothetical protein
VELAKQMQEFLDGEPKPQPKQSTIADYEAATKRTEEVMQHIAKAENSSLDDFYVDYYRVPDSWTLEWKTIPKEQVQMILHAREHDTGKSKRKSPTYPKVRPPNHCKPWKDEELLKAADLVKDAKTRRDLENIAWQLGRTLKGFVDCLYKGLVPIDPATLHKTAFPYWDKVPHPKAPE